jgi:3D (Asp-Asp-Asp) domain-containing protein
MRYFIVTIGLALLSMQSSVAADQSLLARVTVYWNSAASGSRACWNGVRLRAGHCAVDPRRIPYGSRVVFPDLACVAVDTGPDVVNRKAARLCARNAIEKSALVVDRFFETKGEALAWARAHPAYMTLKVLGAESKAHAREAAQACARDSSAALQALLTWTGGCKPPLLVPAAIALTIPSTGG